MRTLNLGILAHVDAGKTSLTERLLYLAGVIAEIGSVDEGTTQTDTLKLERRRGITIKSAVVSFEIDGVTVNLIDTPGHPDFIAEVERVLGVLDGAVLVISAVEGVQPQSRILMRALRRLCLPTLIFANKIDRLGASDERTLRAIAERLTPAVVAMGSVSRPGTRAAAFAAYGATDPAFNVRMLELLADHDESLLRAYVNDGARPSYQELRRELAARTAECLVHPVFFGSAITGAGVESLMTGIRDLLPAAEADANGPPAGTVFKVDRDARGDQVAYVRLRAGTVRVRDRLPFGSPGDAERREGRVNSLQVFKHGSAVSCSSAVAGEIAMLRGLTAVRIGDAVGEDGDATPSQFAPPTLETVVVPLEARDKGALHVALTRLAEQDPLINVRQDDARGELSLSLYGEVQKEVIQETLASDLGVNVEFRETTTVYVERLVGRGEALEVLRAKTKTNVTGASSPHSENPFLATLGLRIEPGAPGSGVEVRLDVDVRLVPIYIYKKVESFIQQMTQYVHEALLEGLYGWRVTDCAVTIIDCGYRAPGSTAGDFRKLAPTVLMAVLRKAGTMVCEPIHRFQIEAPTNALAQILPLLARLDAVPETPRVEGTVCTLEGVLPAARVHALQQQLPAASRGEGIVECSFERYEPLRGPAPIRGGREDSPRGRR